MIIRDTDILSGLTRDAPDPTITNWLNAKPPEEIWTTTITIFEIRYGLSRMQAGRNRTALTTAFETFITEDLATRIAPLDTQAADTAGTLAATRRAAGFNVDIRDTLIAGIARSAAPPSQPATPAASPTSNSP